VLDRGPERFDRLGRDHRFTAAADRRRDHYRQFPAVLVEHFADGDERCLGVQGVEDGLDQEQVGAAGDEGADLLDVGGLHLIEGDHPEP
jgi:hypothetical protein